MKKLKCTRTKNEKYFTLGKEYEVGSIYKIKTEHYLIRDNRDKVWDVILLDKLGVYQFELVED